MRMRQWEQGSGWRQLGWWGWVDTLHWGWRPSWLTWWVQNLIIDNARTWLSQRWRQGWGLVGVSWYIALVMGTKLIDLVCAESHCWQYKNMAESEVEARTRSWGVWTSPEHWCECSWAFIWGTVVFGHSHGIYSTIGDNDVWWWYWWCWYIPTAIKFEDNMGSSIGICSWLGNPATSAVGWWWSQQNCVGAPGCLPASLPAVRMQLQWNKRDMGKRGNSEVNKLRHSD